MSILTKICVVLMLVVSVAASGAFLRIVSVQRSWKQHYKQQEERATVAELTSVKDKIALQKAVAAIADGQRNLATVKDALAGEQTERSGDKTTSAQTITALQGNVDTLKASLADLAKSLDASLAMKKQLLAENGKLGAAVETANESARGLKKRLDGATIQIQRLETMGRHYAVLIKDLQAEKAQLRLELDAAVASAGAGGKASGDAATVITPSPGQPVSGKVTAVERGVASINIGRAKGIQEKMVLKIFRGGKFVAHLRIDLVEPDSAAGVILDKKLDVLQGDSVATDLR